MLMHINMIEMHACLNSVLFSTKVIQLWSPCSSRIDTYNNEILYNIIYLEIAHMQYKKQFALYVPNHIEGIQQHECSRYY